MIAENVKKFLSNLTVVGFDFDDTLVDEAFFIRTRWEVVLKDFSSLHPKLETTFFEIFSDKGHKHNRHLTETFELLNLDLEQTSAIIKKFKETFALDRFNTGALELITYLKKNNIKVGIITNGETSYQIGRLGKLELLGLMDFIYYGDEYRKPATELFTKCLKGLTLEDLDQFLYVGNHLEEDILSSRSIGLKSCWVTHEETPTEIEGVLKVKDLKELVDLFMRAKKL